MNLNLNLKNEYLIDHFINVGIIYVPVWEYHIEIDY